MEDIRQKLVLGTHCILNHKVNYEVNNLNQEIPPWKKFSDNRKIRHTSDGTHEENNIRMAQPLHYSHLDMKQCITRWCDNNL